VRERGREKEENLKRKRSKRGLINFGTNVRLFVNYF